MGEERERERERKTSERHNNPSISLIDMSTARGNLNFNTLILSLSLSLPPARACSFEPLVAPMISLYLRFLSLAAPNGTLFLPLYPLSLGPRARRLLSDSDRRIKRPAESGKGIGLSGGASKFCSRLAARPPARLLSFNASGEKQKSFRVRFVTKSSRANQRPAARERIMGERRDASPASHSDARALM